MFERVLIANRGEIACRIIETCHRLGIATVAVYSDADRDARHVAMADDAVRIGPPPAAESYLDGSAVLAAARATGAGAIHPGYGFLSENPDFVDAVDAAGLVFIGPSAASIRAMGLKDAAKVLMADAGVPVVPGYHGPDQDSAFLAKQASLVGYPVLIKAVAGGGGKGMRRVDHPRDFEAALSSARNEARAAFGSDVVLIEKFITAPRHIEIQIFGDGHGSAVHLYERDCSLQRRHQKVIEEAPAPGMTSEVRTAMGAAAVQAARAIAYRGAGTVEFIVDGSRGLQPGGFWFMEMNTRLQVEHPVTEAITGEDLIEWQLRIAAGAALPKRQEEIAITGHAVEARLYAENPSNGFLPSTGLLSHFDVPPGVRVDTGVRPGDVISPWYDPMIAKVIAHGATRTDALAGLGRALAGTRIDGPATNLGFLVRLLRQPHFAEGRFDTGLIDRHLDALVIVPEPERAEKCAAVLILAGLAGQASGPPYAGFTLWAPLRRSVAIEIGGDRLDATVEVLGSGRFRVDGTEVSVLAAEDRIIDLQIDGRRRRIGVASSAGSVTLFRDGRAFVAHLIDPLLRSGPDSGGGDSIHAPMPGLVRTLLVRPGQAVTLGNTLVVLEAMKMEHSLCAPRDGTIAGVAVAEGDQVAEGDLLLSLEPGDG